MMNVKLMSVCVMALSNLLSLRRNRFRTSIFICAIIHACFNDIIFTLLIDFL